MDTFPIFLRLRQQPVTLVGAGSIAARKLALLERCGAEVTVIAPEASSEIRARASAGAIRWLARPFRDEDLNGSRFVIAATDRIDVNTQVSAAARARGIWVNVVDAPELADALVPAIVDRSPIVLAIGSQGASPVLVRRLRARLESLLEPSLGALARFAERLRARVRGRLPVLSERRRFWESVFDGPVPGLIADGHEARAEQWLDEQLRRPSDAGEVILVGAGPGDPGLLTLAGLRALQRADVILYDKLVSAEVLDLARRDAERIDVGKRAGGHGTSQDTIHALMLEHARSGRVVVRLKGGDAFIFGRGGEELQFLARHAIRYSVVPGITAALGCAAYAGIPLTHRDLAAGVRLVTAHCAKSMDRVDWASLAQTRDTCVYYMGLDALPTLRARLIAHGAAPSLPAAVIENGTRREQRVIRCTLGELPETCALWDVKSPALLVLGEVAALADTLTWHGDAHLTALATESLKHAA